MPAKAARTPPAARRTRPSPFPVAKLPPGWLQLYSERARQVVGMCIDAMHARLSDPASLREVPLRDLAQAAQRTQLTAALLTAAEQYRRNPTQSRAPEDASEYLDAVSVEGPSTKHVEPVYIEGSAHACARNKDSDLPPISERPASAEKRELT